MSPAIKAGGLIYVSGTVAADAKGRIPSGDIRAQTRRTLDNIAETLEAAGSSLASAANVAVYLKNAGDFAAMNDVYRACWPQDPPARTTVVTPLAPPDALVEIAAVAVPSGDDRVVVHPSDWVRSPNPYSYGIRAGNTLFLSGLISRNGKDNSVVPGGMATQTRTALDNGAAILEAAGMSCADLVSVRVFVTDTTRLQDLNDAYHRFFPASPPARSTVRTALPGPDYLVEIAMVAVKDPARAAFTTPNADGTPGLGDPNSSSAIRAGNRLYVAGTPGDTAGNKGDVKAQTSETLARIGRTLEAAGFAWNDVAESTVYMPDLSMFADMNAAYGRVFAKDPPARATVGAGLASSDALVEIMVTAVR